MPKKLVPISAENKEIKYDEELPKINNNDDNNTQPIDNDVKKNPKKVMISDKIDYNENNYQFDDNEELESVKSEKKKKKKSKKHKNKDKDRNSNSNINAQEKNEDDYNKSNDIEHNQIDQDENIDF